MHCAWHHCIPWKATYHAAKGRTRMDMLLEKSLFLQYNEVDKKREMGEECHNIATTIQFI
jgi:hypothetical protein